MRYVIGEIQGKDTNLEVFSTEIVFKNITMDEIAVRVNVEKDIKRYK